MSKIKKALRKAVTQQVRTDLVRDSFRNITISNPTAKEKEENQVYGKKETLKLPGKNRRKTMIIIEPAESSRGSHAPSFLSPSADKSLQEESAFKFTDIK